MIAEIASYVLFILAFLAATIAGYVTIGAPDWGFIVLSVIMAGTLIVASLIDFRTHTLPNWLTLSLIAGGILQAWLLPYVWHLDAAIGALAGYVIFWVIGEVYFSARGRDGLGLGDAKLLAAGGAWVGWSGLAPIVMIGSFLGLMIALCVPGMRREELAFGPWLAVGIWTVWLVGIGGGWLHKLWA